MFDYPVQCLHLQHRSLVCLLVVGVEVSASLRGHRSLAGAYPREVELRKRLDDASEHFSTDVALAGVHIVGYVLRRKAAYPLEVVLTLAESLPLHLTNSRRRWMGVVLFSFSSIGVRIAV